MLLCVVMIRRYGLSGITQVGGFVGGINSKIGFQCVADHFIKENELENERSPPRSGPALRLSGPALPPAASGVEGFSVGRISKENCIRMLC
jgi:hypothetical protein